MLLFLQNKVTYIQKYRTGNYIIALQIWTAGVHLMRGALYIQ